MVVDARWLEFDSAALTDEACPSCRCLEPNGPGISGNQVRAGVLSSDHRPRLVPV